MRRFVPISTGSILTASLLFALGAAGCSKVSSAAAGEERPTETFHLEAEDTHFVADGEADPTLHVERGDRVELTFENTQTGVEHAVAVPPFTDRTHVVPSGEKVTLTFVASETGQFRYTCPQHAPFMEGELVVHAEDGSKPEN